ncbi:MAG: FtsX-like permease family protein [Candidatus Hodarchaeales archaeon]
MSFMKRKLQVLFWLSKSNLKMLIVSLTGLIIALSMFAGCMYYIDLTRGDIYLDTFREIEDRNDVVRFYLRVETEEILTTKSFIDGKINELGLENLYKPVEFSPTTYSWDLSFPSYKYGYGYSSEEVFGHHGVNESIIDECVPGSQFPRNTSEILVYAPNADTFDLNSEINLTYDDPTSRRELNHTVTIAGIITDSTIQNDSIYDRLFRRSSSIIGRWYYIRGANIRFFYPLDLYMQLFSELGISRYTMQSVYTYDIDLSDINKFTVIKALDDIIALEKAVHLHVYGDRRGHGGGYLGFDYYYSESDLSWELYNVIMLVNSFSFLFGMLSIPILVLSIALVYFSLGVLNDRRRKTVEMIKSSGVTGKFIFFSLFIEMCILAFIATGIAAIVGIILAFLTGTTSGFLMFTKPVDFSNYVLIMRLSTLQVLLTIGITITFLTYLPAAIKLARTRVTMLENETRKKKRRRIRIPAGKLDITLLVAGFGGIFLFDLFNRLLWMIPGAYEIYFIFMPFIYILVFLSPVFMIVGGVMIFNRIFMLIVPLMGKISWNRNWRLVATAFRQLNVNANFSARTALVLALGISFLLVYAVLPVTLINYNTDTQYYSQGAAITINLHDSSDEELKSVTLALKNVTGLKTTSGAQFHVWTDYYGSSITFLGIESDFHEIAHWQSYYDDESLVDLVTTLYSAQGIEPAIVDSNTATFLEKANPITVESQYEGTIKDLEFSFDIAPVATTEYFPSLMLYRYGSPDPDYWRYSEKYIVCKYSFITAFENPYVEQNQTDALSQFDIERKVWGKVVSGNDPLTVTEEARAALENLGYSNYNLYSVPEQLEITNNSITTVLLWLIVNYNVLGALAVVLACIVLFVGARSSQNAPEVALSRSLGMKLHQLLLLVLSEPFFLFLLSTVSGLIIALFLLLLLIPFLAGGIGYGPPFILSYDLPVLLVLYSLMLLVLFVAGWLFSYLTIRTNVSKMLKTDTLEYHRKTETVRYKHFSKSKKPSKLTGKLINILSRVKNRITGFVRTNKVAFVRGKSSALFFLSRSNLKLLIGSLLGLVIALSLLAGCLNYIEFSKPELYIDFFEENGHDSITFTTGSIPNGSTTADEIRTNEQFLEQKKVQYSLGDLLVKPRFATSVFLHETTSYQGQESDQLLSGYQDLDEETLMKDCATGSRLPANSNEIIAITPVGTKLAVNDDITVNITVGYGPFKRVYKLNLTVTAILTDETVGEDSVIRKNFSLNMYHLFTLLEHFIPIAQAVQDVMAEDDLNILLLETYRYNINHQGIDRTKAVQSVENLLDFLSDLSLMSFSRKTSLSIDISLVYEFTQWMTFARAFIPQFLLISTPVFILVVLLVLYSLGVINVKRLRAVALVKTRGFSGNFLFITLLFETFIITLIATVISTIVGIPLALFMGTSNGFMVFTNDISEYLIVINPQTLVTLFVAGIALAFFTHVVSIVKLSRSSAEIIEEERSKKLRRKEKRFLRSNLDIVLLVSGILGLMILNVFMVLLREAVSQRDLFDYGSNPLEVFTPFIVLLLFLSPLFFLVGFILSYQRFIPYTLSVFGRVAWRWDWRLLATVTRNLSVNARLTARTALVLTIVVSFFIGLLILPLSVQSYLTDSLYFKNGSDLTVSLTNLSEEEITEIETSLTEVEGLKTTRVSQTSLSIGDRPGPDMSGSFWLRLLGIQESFAETAHWESHYDDESLKRLVSTLYGSFDNHSTIIVHYNGEQDELDQLLSITGSNLIIDPVAFANYFPGMISAWSQENIYAVCRYSYLQNINTSSSIQQELWIKILPGHDPLNVSALVKETLKELDYPSTGVVSLPEFIANAEDTRVTKLVWLAVNFSVIGTLAVLISGILLFSLANMTRNVSEIGLGRALGMKGHQLYLMMITEPFILFILACIPGGMIAILLLEGLLAVYGSNIFWGAPFVLYTNWLFLSTFYGAILLLMIAVGAVVTARVMKSDIIKLLKEE